MQAVPDSGSQFDLLLKADRSEEAVMLAMGMVADNPASASAWLRVGIALHRQRRPEAALAAAEKALSLDPELDHAREVCATLLLGLKRPRAALRLIEALARRRQEEVDTVVNAGVVLEELGDSAAALEKYDAALRRNARNYRARLNRGALLARLGRLENALHDDRALVRSHVGSAAAHYNLADVLLRLDRYAEALASVERALRIAPQSVAPLMLRGLALSMLGRDAEARESFGNASTIDAVAAERYRCAAANAAGLAVPQRLTLDPRQIRLARLLERQKTCDWNERERLVAGMQALAADLARAPAPLEEMGLYHTALSLPLTAAEQRVLSQGIAANVVTYVVADANESVGLMEGPATRKRTKKKIRLGFLSPDFREHPAAQLHWRQISDHDRERFEVFGYSIHRGNGGEMRSRIELACDAFREVSALNARELALRIALDGIDILVDLAGYTDFCRPEVLAQHPAPLRVSYLGVPATVGAGLIDYRITDVQATPPEGQECWGEKLVFLPDTLWIYNDQEPIAEWKPDRQEMGLPEHGLVFCCFNAAYKIEPDVFAVWMRLLAAVPGSVLWLLDGGEEVSRNLQGEAAVRGLAPQRLVFAPRLPREAHLARHACADLFLDTFYYNAHTTAADALWTGLPVLTCPGSTMASRICASIVRAAGLPELVAPDHAAYEAMALRLATHPEELAALRAKLAANRLRCALFDTARRVRELDRAFEMMWQRHLAGLPAENMWVPREAGIRS